MDSNLIGIQPDFSTNSNYNPKSNAGQVKFGADAPVLEVELNELQQIQDKAREDLIRSTIPSGFTKPVKLDLARDKYGSDSNTLYTAEDAEAYVNGMRIFIPKGTKIDIGDSPKKDTREDLVFLEVWKEEVSANSELTEYGGEGQANIPNKLVDPRVGEETSRRIVNRWRIRCAHNAPFDCTDLEDGLGYFTQSMNNTYYPRVIMPQANLTEPYKATSDSDYYKNMFRKAKVSGFNWQTYNSVDDEGLFIAGSTMFSADDYTTADGLVYAIPMFRLHRRPNQGFSTGDYTSISRLADPTKIANILKEEKVASVATGEVECVVEGKTMQNLISGAPILYVQNSGKVTGTQSGNKITIKRVATGDTGYIYVGVPMNLKALEKDTDYTLAFEANGQADCSDAYFNIMLNSATDDLGGARYSRKSGLNVVHFRTNATSTEITGQVLYMGVNNYNGVEVLPNINNEMSLWGFRILKGHIPEDKVPEYFEKFQSVGDYRIRLDRFVAWQTQITNGTANDNIATIPVELKNPYLRVAPVSDTGEEIVDANVAFKLLNASGGELDWNSCPNTIKKDNFQDVKSVKIFCNNLAKTNKISGFNIYTGNNIILKSTIGNDKESVMEIQVDKPIMSIDENIRDLAFGDGRVYRKVKEEVLNGTENWSSTLLTSTNGKFLIFQLPFPKMARTKLLSSVAYIDVMGDTHSQTLNREFIGIYKGFQANSEWIYLSVYSANIPNKNLEGLKTYLKANPLKFYYEPKETTLSPELPNGVKDLDDLHGTITRNIGVIPAPKTLNWGLDTGINQSESCLRFRVELKDKKSLKNNDNIYGNDVYCAEIPTIRRVSGETKIPSLWSWYNKAIYIDVTASMIGVNFSSDSNETKIAKFKQWLNEKGAIYYELERPTLVNYPMEYANVEGNLLFTDNDTATITCDSNIKPTVHLSHKADINLDLFAEKCYVSTNSIIPPSTLEVNGQTSNTGSLELSLSDEVKKAPVKISGMTLNNLLIPKKANLQGGWVLQDDNIFSVESDGNGFADIRFNDLPIKPNTNYTCYIEILENTLAGEGGISVFGISEFGNGTSIPYNSKGVIKVKSLSTDKNGFYFGFYKNSIKTGNLKIKLMLIEGDFINKTLNYFESIKSFAQEENKISILSSGKNLWNKELFVPKLLDINSWGTRGAYRNNEQMIYLEKGKYYITIPDILVPPRLYPVLSIKDKSGTSLGSILTGGVYNNEGSDTPKLVPKRTTTFTIIDEGYHYFNGIFQGGWTQENLNKYKSILESNFQIERSSSPTEYEPYKEDKKDILIKEPLRSIGDIKDIMYEDNGQVKINRYVKEYTFTGDEDFIDASNTFPSDNSMMFGVKLPDALQRNTNVITNNFVNRVITSDVNNEGFYISVLDNNTGVYFRIKKDKLKTENINGFKEWLKSNPTTIVYELATPVTEVIKSVFNSNVHDKADFKGQVGYKRTSESGIDCGYVSVNTTSTSEWVTNSMKEFNYSYPYGDIHDLVGLPLGTGGGYKDTIRNNFRIIKVLSDNKLLLQNTGGTMPENFGRAFYPLPMCSTAISFADLVDLQKQVSFTGTDYNNLLEKLVLKHLY